MTDKLRKIDLYGRKVTLRFDEDSNFKTKCGCFSTLVLFITAGVMFTYEMISIFKGEITDISDFTTRLNPSQLRKANWEDTLLVGVGLDTSDHTIYDYIKLEYKLFDRINKSYTDNMKVTDCTQEVMKKLSKINKLSIENNIRVQCFEINASKFLEGSVPELFLSSCKTSGSKNNSIDSSRCKKMNPEILKKL